MLNLETLSYFIKSNALIKREDSIVIGVSGGADSICLLHILNELKKALEIRLFVVHINHGIRGEEAFRDENFVKEFCEKLNVKFFKFQYDIPKMSRDMKISEEEAGRKARYDSFYKVAEEITNREACDIKNIKIAVAHNKNDNGETVLHNLSRGSGIAGLRGIAAKSGMLIRPLIAFTRDEIEEYLKTNNVPYKTDSTNSKNDYTRNILRNEVFPILKNNVNSNVIDNIYKSSRLISEADEYFENIARKFCKDNLSVRDEFSFALNKEKLLLLSHIEASYVIRYCLREILKEYGFGIKDIGMIHIEDVLNLSKSENGKKIDLKYSIKVYNEYRDIIFVKNTNKESNKIISGVRYNIINEFNIENIPKEKSRKWFDFDKVMETIVKYSGESIIAKPGAFKWEISDFFSKKISIRSIETGDFISIAGGRKAIKKMLTDEKIPARLRAKYRVFAVGQDVLWVLSENEGGLNRIGSCYKVDEGTERILEIEIV